MIMLIVSCQNRAGKISTFLSDHVILTSLGMQHFLATFQAVFRGEISTYLSDVVSTFAWQLINWISEINKIPSDQNFTCEKPADVLGVGIVNPDYMICVYVAVLGGWVILTPCVSLVLPAGSKTTLWCQETSLQLLLTFVSIVTLSFLTVTNIFQRQLCKDLIETNNWYSSPQLQI